MNKERWIIVGIGVIAVGSALVLLGTGPEAPPPATKTVEVADADLDDAPETPKKRRGKRKKASRLSKSEPVPLAQRKGPREAPSEVGRRDEHRAKKREMMAASKPKDGPDRLKNWRSPETMAGRGTSGVWTRVASEVNEVDPALAERARRMSVDLRNTRKAEDPVDWNALVASQRDLLTAVTSSSAWGDSEVLAQKVERITATLDYMESNPDWEQDQKQARAERRSKRGEEGSVGPG